MRFFLILCMALSFIVGASFEDAQKLFEEKSYVKAYSQFHSLLEKDLTNLEYVMYVAKCQYALGEFLDSEKTLTPFVGQNSKNETLILLYARALYAQKKYEKARNALESLESKEGKSLLASINKSEQNHHFSGLVSIGFSYDDNVKNNTHLDTTPYAGMLLRNDTSKKRDTAHQEMLFVRHLYDMPKHPNLSWQSSLLLFNKTLSKYSEENIVFGSIKSGPLYKKGDYTTGAYAIYDRLFYDSDDYLYAYGAGANLQKIINSYLLIYTNIEFKKRKYKQNIDTTKDASRFSASLGLAQYLTPKDVINYSLTGAKDRKERGSRIDISRLGWNYELAYTKIMDNDIKIQTKLGYETISYSDKDVILGKRRDKRLNITAALSKDIYKDLNLSLNYNFTDTDSNINAYSYRKNNTLLLLSKSF